MHATVRRASLLAFATALMISPAAARAQPPDSAGAVVYEVMESMTLGGSGNVIRKATATLVGWAKADTPICPKTLKVPYCFVNVIASDTVRIDTGKGTITGDFQVVKQDDNSEDGPELVILSGTLRADIDLGPAVLHDIPLAYLTKGSLRGSGAKGGPLDRLIVRGDFTGTFRLPFRRTPTSPESYLILTPDGPVDEPVLPDERSLGTPTVRLEIDFKQQQ